MKYLHRIESALPEGTTVYYLDHRLCTEVQSMMVSMVSRMPEGGVARRYAELVEKVAKQIAVDDKFSFAGKGDVDSWWEDVLYKGHKIHLLLLAEDRLCEYPLHPIVAEHFQKWVGEYGHSSITEHNAEPMVFIDGISRWLAWMLFDNPLVSGQEASTRAIDFGKRPACPEAAMLTAGMVGEEAAQNSISLQGLHEDWMKVRDAELEWWKADLQKPCMNCSGRGHYKDEDGTDLPNNECASCNGTGRKHPWMKDPQPFRPAFDRSRWALPGTISTGCAFSYSLRAASRSMAQAYSYATLSNNTPALQILDAVYEAYWKAAPGLAPLVLKKPKQPATLPSHLIINSRYPRASESIFGKGTVKVRIRDLSQLLGLEEIVTTPRTTRRAYVDPLWNQRFRVDISIRCSLAAATDWHRHRSAYPWTLEVSKDSTDGIVLCDEYLAYATDPQTVAELRARTGRLYDEFRRGGDYFRAMLCLPLGAEVIMNASMGLRDFVYMMELRGYVAGANFEYMKQAREALKQLVERIQLNFSDEYASELLENLGLNLDVDTLTKQAQ